jgi:hypothetical protein
MFVWLTGRGLHGKPRIQKGKQQWQVTRGGHLRIGGRDPALQQVFHRGINAMALPGLGRQRRESAKVPIDRSRWFGRLWWWM